MKDTIDKHARLTNKNKKMRKKNKRADDALGRAHRARRQLQENEKKNNTRASFDLGPLSKPRP